MATEADFKRIGNFARMYNPQQNIDRSQCQRVVPMEVFCPGYSRTGTLSMHKALEILGYPNPYHFSAFYDNICECDMWVKALNAKFYGKGEMPDKAFFDGMLGHVGATTDAPCNLFIQELVEFYPEAKVVLVQRDLDSWFVSWTAFCENTYNPVLPVLGFLEPSFCGRVVRIGTLLTDILAGFSTNTAQARVRSKNAYLHHYRDVREIVPKERLLDFDLKEGWEPLCAFLGKPVPSVAFPHVNDKESIAQAIKELGQVTIPRILRNILVIVSGVGVPTAAFYWYQRRR